MTKESYGLLSYSTQNLGDEIQSIAARQFLPSVDLLVDRDQLNKPPEKAEGRCKLILNGWHTRHPRNWPPSAALDPLLISMHFTNEIHPLNRSGHRPADFLLQGETLEYLRAHGPVGARDLWTLDLLNKKSVDAYFSGCLTLTLGAGPAQTRGDYICAVDLPEDVLESLRARTRERIVITTHADPTPAPFDARMRRAERLLSLYAQAKYVVTSRLHCAMPCLALRTPVLLVISAKDTYRFSGLKELVRHYTPEQFLADEQDFDFDNPAPNSDAHLSYRKDLIRRVNAFINPTSRDDEIRSPFIPNTDIENLIAIEQLLAQQELSVTRTRQAFRQVFKPGMNYQHYSRPDFLRDIAKVHRGLGNPGEARRLLEIALTERPEPADIRRRNRDIEPSDRQPKRFEAFGVGCAKSGTNSLAEMFRDRYRAAHEPMSHELIELILARSRMPEAAFDETFRKILTPLDLEMNASQINGYVIDTLVRSFPQAKFILTLRAPGPWACSFVNHQMTRGNLAPHSPWAKFRDLRFSSDQPTGGNNAYSITQYLNYWLAHNVSVIRAVPEDRLLIVRTEKLNAEIPRFADFLGIPAETIGKAHANAGTYIEAPEALLNERELADAATEYAKKLYELTGIEL